MSQKYTPLLGKFLGLSIPVNAEVCLDVHGLSVEQCEALLNGALRSGLQLDWSSPHGSRWIDVGSGAARLCIYPPRDFPSESEFMAKWAKPTEPFEIAAPEAVTA